MDEKAVKELRGKLHDIEGAYRIAQERLTELDFDRRALARVIEMLGAMTKPAPKVTADEIRGLTQEDALVRIAEANGGKLIFSQARELLVEAGLIKNPVNAATILYTTLNRRDRFERVRRGVYRLVPSNESIPESPKDQVIDDAWFVPESDDGAPTWEPVPLPSVTERLSSRRAG